MVEAINSQRRVRMRRGSGHLPCHHGNLFNSESHSLPSPVTNTILICSMSYRYLLLSRCWPQILDRCRWIPQQILRSLLQLRRVNGFKPFNTPDINDINSLLTQQLQHWHLRMRGFVDVKELASINGKPGLYKIEA